MSVQNLLQTLNPTPLKNGGMPSDKVKGENVKELATLLTEQGSTQTAEFSNLLENILGQNLDESQQEVLLQKIEDGIDPEVALKIVKAEKAESNNSKTTKAFPLQIGVAGLEKIEVSKDSLNVQPKMLDGEVVEDGKKPQVGTEKLKTIAKGTGLFAGLKISSSKLPTLNSKTVDQNEKSDFFPKQEKGQHSKVTTAEDQLQLLQNKNLKTPTKIHTAYQANANAEGSLIKMNRGKNIKSESETLFSKITSHHDTKATVKDPLQAVLSKEDTHAENLLRNSESSAFHMMKEGIHHSHNIKSAQPLMNIENANSQELINKIVDYIEQNSVIKNNSLNLTVHHKQLGQFDIAVTQNQHTKALDVMINSTTQEGTQFFQANEHKLLAKLQTAGFELNDFKIVSRMAQVDAGRHSGESMFNNNNSGQSRGWSSHQQGSHQESADGQRRRELWEEYKERYYA